MTDPSPTSPPRSRSLAALALVLLATLPYANVVATGGYVADDVLFLRDNPRADDPGAMLHTGWTRPLWNLHRPDAEPVNPYYRPLTVSLFALTHALDPSPRGHHLANVLLHATVVLLAARLGARRAPARVAWLAAALFALHPVHTEAVAWISGAMAPLAAALGLACLLAWDASRSRPPLALVAGATFALALLAYEAALVLPLLAWLLDRTARERPRAASTLARSVPLVAALAIVFLLRCAVFGSWSAGVERSPDLGLGTARAWSLRLEVLGEGLRLLAWPATLTPYREIDPAGADGARLAIAGLGLAVAAWVLVRVRGTPRFGVAWFLLALAPLLAPGSLGRFPFSERFLYLPTLGACLAIAAPLSRGLAAPRLRPVVLLLLATAAAFATLRVRERNRDYADEASFRAAALAIEPETPQLLAEALSASLARPIATLPLRERSAVQTERLALAHAILALLDRRIVTNNDLAPVLVLARRRAAEGDPELANQVARRTGLR